MTTSNGRRNGFANGHTSSQVDWDKAMTAMERCMAGGDQNDFVNAALPMADNYAKLKSRQYAGSQYATDIDYDACLSAAMEGLRQVAGKESLGANPTSDKLRNLCATAISCRLVDLERQVLGRRTRKVRPDSLHVVTAQGETRSQMAIDGLGHKADQSYEMSDELKGLITRLKGILGPEQFEVMRAVITLRPLGYTAQEIGESIGKDPSTVASTISLVRKKLRSVYPEVEAEMVAILSEAITEGSRGGHGMRRTF